MFGFVDLFNVINLPAAKSDIFTNLNAHVNKYALSLINKHKHELLQKRLLYVCTMEVKVETKERRNSFWEMGGEIKNSWNHYEWCWNNKNIWKLMKTLRCDYWLCYMLYVKTYINNVKPNMSFQYYMKLKTSSIKTRTHAVLSSDSCKHHCV